MTAAETAELRQRFSETSGALLMAVMEQDLAAQDALIIGLQEPLSLYLAVSLKWLAVISPFVALLTIILLILDLNLPPISPIELR